MKSYSSRNDATEKMLRRREWKLEQERQRQHERLKQKKIYEYEMQRAREKGLLPPKPPNRSKSRSKSPRSRPRRPCTSSSTNTLILSERLESADGTVPLFKGSEDTKISTAELRKIKVDIHRNIPGKSSDSDLQRDIMNPEDVVVKRRAGEGSKPIFEREEIKAVVTKTEEVDEHRAVVTVNNDTSGKSKTFKKRSASLSQIRNRSYSPQRTLSRHSRDEWSNCYRDRKDRDRSREQRAPAPHYVGQIPVPIYYSRYFVQFCPIFTLQEDKGLVLICSSFGMEYCMNAFDTKMTSFCSQSTITNIDQYLLEANLADRHFPSRPIIMAHLMPIREQVLLGNTSYPPMMGPLRPFSLRFMPPDMHRFRTPSYPRFRTMF